jgi:hypothetical protein
MCRNLKRLKVNKAKVPRLHAVIIISPSVVDPDSILGFEIQNIIAIKGN